MKRPERILKTVLLIVAAFLAVFGTCVFMVLRVPEGGAGKVVKEFPLSSGKDLGEWEEKQLCKSRTVYSITEQDGRKCAVAESEGSASALFYKQKLTWERDPFVSWDWKAGKFPDHRTKQSLDKKSEFDFVAQVYVIFAARFFLNMKAIQYVWTKDLPAGTVGHSPYTRNVRLLVLETGETEGWAHEERDIRKDYRELFGEELEKDVAAVSFMTDSDSTESSATAYFSNIKIGYMDKVREGQPGGQEHARNPLKLFCDRIKKLVDSLKSERKEQPSDI